jgi:hypothetical protein
MIISRRFFSLALILLLLFTSNSLVTSQTTKTIGATGADYATLKDAFDAINAGLLTGSITLQVVASTTETTSAVLNASGVGSASYSSVLIYPSVTGLSISGDIAKPLIDFNGADNVVIDGRVNAAGTQKDLTIINSSISNVAATSAIRFINDATLNTVKYCTIRGSHTHGNTGVIFFSTTTGTTGNDNNTIDNNNITGSSDLNRPKVLIYSQGTSSELNSENIISNNNIYDFLNRNGNTYGIWLLDNNSAWTISGNSLYETATFVPSASGSHDFINVSGSSGENFTVENNYIGGSAPNCGGVPLTKTNAFNNNFYGITVLSSIGIENNIQGNTIKNIDYRNTLVQSFWNGITATRGNTNIGTVTGNIIGDPAGNSSIVFSSSNNASEIRGINVAGAGIKTIQNNSIGSITLYNSDPVLATSFVGIRCSADGSSVDISGNLIGSTDPLTSNSIYQTSASTGNSASITGISSGGSTDEVWIAGNIISKLTNAATGPSRVNGIEVSLGVLSSIYSVLNNTISELKDQGSSTSIDYKLSVIGILFENINSSSHIIQGNTIYNLSNNNPSFAGGIAGIYNYGTTELNTIKENFIYSLSIDGASSTNGKLFGIKHDNGSATYSNNIISLGGNSQSAIYGIYTSGLSEQLNNIYFNTIYIGGSPVSGVNSSYGLYSEVSSNIRDIRNNIFFNNRSNNGSGGKHYAVYFNYSSIAGLVLGYNNYFTPGTGGVLGFYNLADVNSLPLVPALDGNSLNINPGLINAGGLLADDYKPSATMNGISGSGITSDYYGVPRPSIPAMGAIENSLPTSADLNSVTSEIFTFLQNSPNPFKSVTRIRYNLLYPGQITLKIFNGFGYEVATLESTNKPAGSYEIEFNASSFPDGIYYCRLQAGNTVLTKKMLKMK